MGVFMRITVGTLLVAALAAPAGAFPFSGAQLPQGGYRTAASTGATGTAGMGATNRGTAQRGHLNDSTGNHWVLVANPRECNYTLMFKGQNVGTIVFVLDPFPPPFNFIIEDTAGMEFSTGTFTPIP